MNDIPFKPGDLVECVNSGATEDCNGTPLLNEQHCYLVVDCDESEVRIKMPRGDDMWWRNSRFKLFDGD